MALKRYFSQPLSVRDFENWKIRLNVLVKVKGTKFNLKILGLHDFYCQSIGEKWIFLKTITTERMKSYKLSKKTLFNTRRLMNSLSSRCKSGQWYHWYFDLRRIDWFKQHINPSGVISYTEVMESGTWYVSVYIFCVDVFKGCLFKDDIKYSYLIKIICTQLYNFSTSIKY